ncbi:MAG: 4-hydroxy-tetrahydrodipicolinate reductase [Bdellovibrionales bacterium]
MARVLVNGAKGKMGSMTVASVKADPALTLVGEADLGDDLAKAIKDCRAEVVVDFTNADVGYDNFTKIIEAGAHPVAGTSGFNKDQVLKLKDLCRTKGIGALIAPNFSIGGVLMMKFAEQAAKYMPHAEVIEAHHEQKLDAPSGTAIRTAEMIHDAAAGNNGVNTINGKETIPGVRGGRVATVPVHSVRLPGYLAHQRVIFGSVGQTLIIEHTSINRKSFMAGVCLAAQKIVGEKELFYGLETLLFRD